MKGVITSAAAISELVSIPQDSAKVKEEEKLFLGDRSLYETTLSLECVTIVKKNLRSFVVEAR